MKTAPAYSVGFANIRGTAGLFSGGLKRLQELAVETQFLGLAEVDVCTSRGRSALKRTFTHPLEEIAAGAWPKRRTFFFPLVSADASLPDRGLWQKLPRWIKAPKGNIETAAAGIGVIALPCLCHLFGRHPFAGPSAPVLGHFGTGAVGYSTLLDGGYRDHEPRGVVFTVVPFQQELDLLVGILHMSTLLGEREQSPNLVIEVAARGIRGFQCQELCWAISHVRETYRKESGRFLAVLLIGDFNCEPEALELKDLRDAANLTCVFKPPYPATKRNSNLCLDHAWVSRELSVLGSRTEDIGDSDHKAVIVTLARG